MPPPVSDEELSNVDEDIEIPVESHKRSALNVLEESEIEPTPEPKAEEAEAKQQDATGVAKDEEEDEEDGEGVYVVEAIKGHLISKNGIRFQVKWEGYDDEADMTWEPEENLMDSASGILNAYYDSIGGRDYILNERKKKKRGRPSTSAGTPDPKTNGSKRARRSEAGHPSSSTPPASLKNATFKPPSGSWEDDVQGIDACEGTDGEVMVFLQWSNGQKTQHPLHIVYKRCPQKMLKFYESHLSFTPITHATKGSTDTVLESSKKARGRPRKKI